MSRRRRKFTTSSRTWQPGFRNPYRGTVVWPTEESATEMTVTLFRRTNDTQYEDKIYHLVVEETKANDKSKPIGYVKVNLAQYVDDSTFARHHDSIKLTLIPLSKKLVSGEISMSISTQFIKEGLASDEDMISVASLLSMQAANEDIGNLRDFDDANDGNNTTSSTNETTAIISAELSQLITEISDFTNQSSEGNTEAPRVTDSLSIDENIISSNDAHRSPTKQQKQLDKQNVDSSNEQNIPSTECFSLEKKNSTSSLHLRKGDIDLTCTNDNNDNNEEAVASIELNNSTYLTDEIVYDTSKCNELKQADVQSNIQTMDDEASSYSSSSFPVNCKDDAILKEAR